MKVAYLIAQYPKTSHTFIRREIAALERLGIMVQRYSTRGANELLVDRDDIAERALTRVILEAGPLMLLGHTVMLALRRPRHWVGALLDALHMGWRSDRGLLFYLIYLCEACALVRWMEEEHIDHLHAHFATNAASIALLSRRLGGPTYSFMMHGPDELDLGPFISLGRKVHEATFAAAISHYARAHLLRFSSPDDWAKICIVRCGLDSTYLDQPSVPLPKEPKLVCVARFEAVKGHLVLLEAAARLAGEGVAFELDLIGDGPLRPDIERAILRLGLERRVVLSGWLSSAQVRERLLSNRIFVLPSFAEGLPVVLMEALALGRPVIATYVAGVPELVVPGENGWLVPASSVDALVHAMREALTTPHEELERMGVRGRERVKAQHDVSIEAGKLAGLFQAGPTRPVGASDPGPPRVELEGPA
jgi:colanic acid/amylovoran biosynthesis glycosyltransferase